MDLDETKQNGDETTTSSDKNIEEAEDNGEEQGSGDVTTQPTGDNGGGESNTDGESWEQFKWDPEVIDGRATIDAADSKGFLELAKKSNLSPKQTREALDYAQGIAKRQQQELLKAIENQHDKYIDDIQNDKDIGGKKWEESLDLASAGIAHFKDDELKNLLSHIGFPKPLFKVFLQVGKMVKESSGLATGGNNIEKQKRPQDIIYGHLFQNKN